MPGQRAERRTVTARPAARPSRMRATSWGQVSGPCRKRQFRPSTFSRGYLRKERLRMRAMGLRNLLCSRGSAE